MARIYVALMDEGTDVWRPVEAVDLGGRYRIEGPMPDDERWAFPPGSAVRCAERTFDGGVSALVAAEVAAEPAAAADRKTLLDRAGAADAEQYGVRGNPLAGAAPAAVRCKRPASAGSGPVSAVSSTHFRQGRLMAQVRELLERKGSHVLTVGPAASVLQAATLMNEHRVGALVAVEDGRVAGIFTERDVLRRVVGEGRDPAATRVGEVMTAAVVCCSPETTADEARGAMRDRRIRHLPVADADGRLLGLISIGDLNAELLAAREQTVFLLTEYIHGRA